MANISDGQCGRCAHYGEDHAPNEQIVQMRINGIAPDGYIDSCGHPNNAGLHLKVTPTSGCDGFKPAAA